MKSDKEQKKEFKLETSNNPDKYYAVEHLRSEGFMRKHCKKCGTFFWTVEADQELCGDPSCSGGFRFIGNTPAKEEMDYIETWKKFAGLFTKLGYTPIKRYPVVARWRDDTEFVRASIYDFQPYVVNGTIEPPANPLVVPQFCLRFNDIENVGITGSHYTGFVMIGQHMFVPEEKWDQNKVFSDIHTWLKKGLGLPNKEITFHEDAWAGGGNFGPCMEYFSRGLELGNQVYMLYEQTPHGRAGLPLKVLDMGMGHERNAWFSKGTSTSYETTFPTVSKKLNKITGIKIDQDLMMRFLPYSSYLNIDEVDDINKTWDDVAKRVGVDTKELRDKIEPLAGMLSVAEHARSLLFAIADGALPSNVGGGYDLRGIYRRSLSFIDKYGWDVSMNDVTDWHAEYLKPLFPELSEKVEDVKKILDVEKQKYYSTKEKSKQKIVQILKKGDIGEPTFLELYSSHGISPEMIQEQAKEMGQKIKAPDNFYAKVSEMNEKASQKIVKEDKIDLKGLPDTDILYWKSFDIIESKGKVLRIIGKNVVLDRTVFYPTSGGQIHDIGHMDGNRIMAAFKQGPHVVHVLEKEPDFKEGDIVDVKVDYDRRLQLAQHHTSTHIINGVAKKILGNHIWQAGANKDIDKARLDITHYEALDKDTEMRIEKEANRIIEENLPVYSDIMPRNLAEAEYGFTIYQGGAVPGKSLRIVKIPGLDTEACGGTHLSLTGQAKLIKILKSSKIQDGIVRIEFTAGEAAASNVSREMGILQEAAKLLSCHINQVPGRSQELFEKWKNVVKKKQTDPENFRLTSKDVYEGAILEKTAEILKTQPEHIPKTISRFMQEIEKAKQ